MKQNGSVNYLELIKKSAEIYYQNSNWPFDDSKSSSCTFINHYSLIISSDEKIKLACFDLIFIDGIALAHQVSRKIGTNIPRISFDLSSVARKWIYSAMQRSSNLIFAGGTINDIQRFSTWMHKELHDPTISKCKLSFIDGFQVSLIKKIFASLSYEDFNFIVLGLGSPLQERLSLEITAYLNDKGYRGIVLTCGGFISQTAIGSLNNNEFYPKWINKLNLRWLYRCYKQPYVIKRIIFTYPKSYVRVKRNNIE